MNRGIDAEEYLSMLRFGAEECLSQLQEMLQIALEALDDADPLLRQWRAL